MCNFAFLSLNQVNHPFLIHQTPDTFQVKFAIQITKKVNIILYRTRLYNIIKPIHLENHIDAQIYRLLRHLHLLKMNIPQRFESYTTTDFYQTAKINFFSKQTINDPSQHQSEGGSDIALQNFQGISTPFTYEENFKPLMDGWLKKKTLNTTYQERFFVLTPTRLCYFADDDMTELKGCFNFVSLLNYGLMVTIEDFQIKIKVSPKTHSEEFLNRHILQIQFNSKSQLRIWHDEITNVINQLTLRYHILGDDLLALYPSVGIDSLLQMNQKIGSQFNSNFWNKLDISVPQLCAYSSHLDILLLRSKNPVAYVSRFFMRSYYDHVALIIKSELHEIFVFEAIESRGVCLIDLETFLKINKDEYEEIAFRKLMIKQSKSEEEEGMYKGVNLQKLENYLNSLLGKRYELSLSKLLMDEEQMEESVRMRNPRTGKDKKFSQQNKQNEVSSIIDQLKSQMENREQRIQKPEKTYFCSQLIADIYLKFGIIKQGKSKDFWPKDFQNNDIKLKPNAWLSPVMNIIL